MTRFRRSLARGIAARRRKPHRRVMFAVSAMCVCLALVVVVMIRTTGLHNTLNLINIIGLVVGVVGFILTILQLFIGVSVHPSDIDDAAQLGQAMAVLADQVEIQWETEARNRGLSQTEPIEVRWKTTDHQVGASAEAIIGATSMTRPIRLRLYGQLNESVEKFRQLPRQQLVVLGEPGSGKTVFSLFFTLNLIKLIKERNEKDRVPVLLSIASWNPTTEPLSDWIARRIDEDYPALRWIDLSTGGVVDRLVASGLILPILDGLDEISGDLLGAAVSEIGRSIGTRPMVVTCRTNEYVAAVRAGGVLARAAVVELQPVAIGEAIRFMSAAVADGARKWQPVETAIRSGDFDHVAKALSTPLMISMGRTAYAMPGADPRELLDQRHFPDQASVETHLLAEYIPTVFGPRYVINGKRPPSLDKAHRWLTFVATYLKDSNTRDLSWWQLHSVLRRRTIHLIFTLFVWITGIVISCIVFGPIVGKSFFSMIGMIAGSACGLTAVLAARYGTVPGPPVRLLIAKGRRTRIGDIIRSAVVGGLAPGLVVVGAVSLASNLFLGVVLGLIVFGLAGIVAGILRWSAPAERALAVSPRAVLAADRRATMFLGTAISVLTAAFVFATYSSKYSDAQAATAAVLAGLVLGFGFMLGTAWAWYHLTKAILVLKRRLPWRFMAFLDEAHQRGVLRVAGAVYQFRHARLQDFLAGEGPVHSPPNAAEDPAVVA